MSGFAVSLPSCAPLLSLFISLAPPDRMTRPAQDATHIDLAILKALLQVVVDGLVGNLANEGKIRDSHLLLLGALESGLPDLGLAAAAAGLCGSGILLSSSALGDGLNHCVSWAQESRRGEIGYTMRGQVYGQQSRALLLRRLTALSLG